MIMLAGFPYTMSIGCWMFGQWIKATVKTQIRHNPRLPNSCFYRGQAISSTVRGLSYKKVRLFDPYFWSLERPKLYYLIVLTAKTIVLIVLTCETFGRLKRTFF